MRPNDYNQDSMIPHKSSCRQEIVKKGYDIVVNIGDQYSDLAGGYSDATFKYPNYVQITP
jgi:predicted secreted acid phosphatase